MVSLRSELVEANPPCNQGRSTSAQLSIADEAAKLAQKRARKAQLLLEAAGQFIEIERPVRKDISLFRELFYQLVGGCGKSERRQLAQLLARHPYVPRQIALFLALDDHDIAAPVLLFSPVLNEADLVVLARRLARDHLSVLCRRTELTAPAVRALVQNGGPICARLLEKNPVVLGSPELFSALSGKGALSKKEVVSNAMMAERTEHDTATVKAGRSPAVDEKRVEKELVALAARGGRLGSSTREELSAQTRNESKSGATGGGFERQLLAAARNRDHRAIGTIVAARTGLSADTAIGLITRGGAKNAATLLKGIGLDIMTAMQLVLLTDRSIAKSSRAYEQAKALYKQLDGEKCRRFLIGLGADQTDPWKGRADGRTAPRSADSSRRPAISIMRQAKSA